MKQNKKVLNDDEIIALIRVIGDEELGKISYSQFVEAI